MIFVPIGMHGEELSSEAPGNNSVCSATMQHVDESVLHQLNQASRCEEDTVVLLAPNADEALTILRAGVASDVATKHHVVKVDESSHCLRPDVLCKPSRRPIIFRVNNLDLRDRRQPEKEVSRSSADEGATIPA